MERKEALEIVRKLYNNSLFLKKDKEAMVTLIPELKESEDERIRKWLMALIRSNEYGSVSDAGYMPCPKPRVLAWLKKQGEQPQGKSALEAINEEKIDNQNCIKLADKVEPKFKVGQTIKKEGFNLGFLIVKIEDGFYYNDMGDNFPFTDQDNWELVEQKPAWSEEDEKELEQLIDILHANEYVSFDNWLKSLRPQNNSVTDEELAQAKKDAYNDALDKIEYHSGEPTFDDGWSAAIWYLKKRNAQPQNRWKPSEEMLEALYRAIPENVMEISEDEMLLDKLYQGLKYGRVLSNK